MAPPDGAEPYGSTAGTGTISLPCHGLPKLGHAPLSHIIDVIFGHGHR
jgi:hypothetical protein